MEEAYGMMNVGSVGEIIKLRRCPMVKDKKVENIKSKKYEVYFCDRGVCSRNWGLEYDEEKVLTWGGIK